MREARGLGQVLFFDEVVFFLAADQDALDLDFALFALFRIFSGFAGDRLEIGDAAFWGWGLGLLLGLLKLERLYIHATDGLDLDFLDFHRRAEGWLEAAFLFLPCFALAGEVWEVA